MSESNFKPNILAVDDNRDNLMLIELMLAELDINLVLASSGEKALEHVLNQEFAVILLDVQMPEMDGFEVAKHLQSNKRTKAIPIIFVTANVGDESFMIKGYESGAVDFLPKPVNDVILLSKVKIFMQLYLQKRDLIELKKQADKANEAKSTFLSTMSHEIRTPLNGVIGVSELLQESELNDEQQQLTSMIHSSGESLLELINDVLDLSKIEAGQLEFESIHFDLRTTIDKAIDTVAIKAQEKNLELPVIYSHDIPEGVIGDPTRLRQIIVNLINNAIKFTKNGEVTLKLTIVPNTDPENLAQKWVLFEVIDTGIGIPEDRLNRLFKSFSQVSDSTAREYGGTGLGLSISKQLVEGMKGNIGVNSVEGEGSNFYFSIPFLISSNKTQPIQSSKELHNINILLADTNASNKLMYQELLNGVVNQIISINNGPELYTQLKKTDPLNSILIIDLHLESFTIDELFQKLKELEKVEMPVVAISSLPKRGDGLKMKELGAKAYLTKPIKKNTFINCLNQIVHHDEVNQSKELITKHSIEESHNLNKLKILLAEDNKTNQILFIKMIKKLGYHCDLTKNGQEACEAHQQNKYDIIFMDVNMPILDGVEATKQIREVEQGSDQCIIIAATADNRQEELDKFLTIGFDDILNKPITKSSMENIMKKYSKG